MESRVKLMTPPALRATSPTALGRNVYKETDHDPR
jgi:hypothetical protein